MARITSALAALRRELDFRYLSFFLLVFLVPLDYVLPNMNATLLFCFILAFIVKEDWETQWIDMRWALTLLLTTFLMTETPLETFAHALCGWFFFKSFLYLTAHFPNAAEEDVTAQVSENASGTEAERLFQPLPFVPFFVAGTFAAMTFWMCVSIPSFEQVQAGLTKLLYSDLIPVVPSWHIGTHILPSFLASSLLVCGILFAASYGRLRWKQHAGKIPEYIMGDGDPIIFAVFLGILPFTVYLLSFAFALAFILGAFILQYSKRGTTDVPNR